MYFLGDFDPEDSSNSKTFKTLNSDKKSGSAKDSLNATDKDIMVIFFEKMFLISQ